MDMPSVNTAEAARVFLFSSESVNEGSPEKLCDQVSDAASANEDHPDKLRVGEPTMKKATMKGSVNEGHSEQLCDQVLDVVPVNEGRPDELCDRVSDEQRL